MRIASIKEASHGYIECYQGFLHPIIDSDHWNVELVILRLLVSGDNHSFQGRLAAG
jgi:hypothetical protein